MKRIKWIGCILCLLALAGCGAKPPAQTGRVFTDDLGRTVVVSGTPQRVAALIGSLADVWLLAGGQVVATAEEAWEDFGLELPEAVNIGDAHSLNTELLLSANPDFVIASASTASNMAAKELLEAAGIPVAYFDIDGFYDYLEMLDICTELTGRKDLYEQNGLAVERKIRGIKEAFSLPEGQRKVLLLRAASGSVKAKGSRGTVLGEMLADLGCVNIADSDASLLENLSVESVLLQEPYHIFAVTMGDDTQKAADNLKSLLEDDPAWASLEAVREGRVHRMDRRLFNIKPNARWAEAYEQLGKILSEEQ